MPGIFENLDLLDDKHVEIVADAIKEHRIGFCINEVRAADNLDRVLYGDCQTYLSGPDGRIYCSFEFVPVLDALRQTRMLDRHMLGLVLSELKTNSDVVLGCNVSADNFTDWQSWQFLRDRIAGAQHLAKRLVLEVSESQCLSNLTTATDLLTDARNLGCRVAICDFGRGFATPQCLLNVEADIIKIDSLFVQHVRWGQKDGNSLKHMIGLAGCIAPVVVVEGVQTREQLDIARAAGAGYIQGYPISGETSRNIPTQLPHMTIH